MENVTNCNHVTSLQMGERGKKHGKLQVFSEQGWTQGNGAEQSVRSRLAGDGLKRCGMTKKMFPLAILVGLLTFATVSCSAAKPINGNVAAQKVFQEPEKSDQNNASKVSEGPAAAEPMDSSPPKVSTDAASDNGLSEKKRDNSSAPGPGHSSSNNETATVKKSVEKSESQAFEVQRFEWCPKAKVQNAYEMTDPADQHRIVYPPGATKGSRYPVVIGFHGQPKRGKDPRDYGFMNKVQGLVQKMITEGEIEPVILVLPVFRYVGGNWPWFNPKKFKGKIEELLAAKGISADGYHAFGHSGAAGCGGGGLNQAHLLKPKAVGFFDTCLGKSWQTEIAALEKSNIKTVNIHSVETAGFKPRQRPEYQADFNFGLAYEPLGLKPVKCPAVHPGEKLRKNKYRCSKIPGRKIKGFIIDTGEGVEAHKAMLEPSIRYFLKTVCEFEK